MKALQLVAARQFEAIDIPPPSSPGSGEVVVRVHSMGVCGTDISGYLGKMPFIEFPRILGHELGVEVIAVGEGVSHLKPGDRGAVEPYMNCGSCHACIQGRTNCCETLHVLGVHTDGGMCDSLLLPASKLHVSNNLTYQQLALVEMLAIGCHAVNRAALKPGDEVLIVGAGPIGLTVLEFALIAGANVTVYELGAVRKQFVRDNYPRARVLEAAPAEGQAQVVFDATGNVTSMSQCFHFARFTGTVVFVGITKEPVMLDDPLFHRRELTLLASRNAVAADFTRILALIAAGTVDTRPWISHQAQFDDAPAAFSEWTTPGTSVVKAVINYL